MVNHKFAQLGIPNDSLKSESALATEPTLLATQLEGSRKRNGAREGLLYDICVVTPGEAPVISPWLAWEGSILAEIVRS